MERMKVFLKRISLKTGLLMALLLAGIVFVGKPENVSAQTGYKEMTLSNESSTKIGKYYFKYENYKIAMSNRKNGGYTATSIEYGAFANATQAIYLRDNVVYKYIFSKKKESKLVTLEELDDPDMDMYSIGTVYGKYVYINEDSYSKGAVITYAYDMNSKKIKKVISNGSIDEGHGKYLIVQNEWSIDVSPISKSIYKITNKGIKKVKTLSDFCGAASFVGDKIYYVCYPSGTEMRKAIMYKCDLDGSNKKKVASFSADSGNIIVSDIGAKECTVYKDWTGYKYTYATKKYVQF